MNTLDTIKQVLRNLKVLLTPGVPIGRTAYDAWAALVVKLSGLPDNDSVRFTLATIVLHTDNSKVAFHSKFYFIKNLRAAASKQIASAIFTEAKERQKAAELAAKEAEATAPAAASDGPK